LNTTGLEGKWIAAGYAWAEEEICLELHGFDSGRIENVPLGSKLAFRIFDDRRCAGHIDFEQLRRVPCEERTLLESGTQCAACRAREGFAACVRCDGLSCPPLAPAVQRYCTGIHHLYLATFGGEEVKVGTASQLRRRARLVEQGALVAAYIATAPGPEIKQLERAVASLGYPTAMRRREKLALLGSGVGEAEAEARVLAALDEIARALPASMHDALHPPEPTRQPELARRARSYSYLQSLPLRPGSTVAGEVLGAVGSLVVLDDGGGAAALDLAELRCRVIEMQPRTAESDVSRQLPLLQ
jgi:hypothetical protein